MTCAVRAVRRAPFIYPTNLALSMFHRLDDGVKQMHFCTTPLTGIFNAPNFTGRLAKPQVFGFCFLRL
jgi:hypothetical protein